MPSANFNSIKGMIAAKKPIYAKYKGEAEVRKLCPYVLGYKEQGGSETEQNERVLCYQVDGPNSSKGWRCFVVKALEIVSPPPPPSDWVDRPDYSKWQNSVQEIKHKRPR